MTCLNEHIFVCYVIVQQEPSIMQNTEVVLVRENQMDGGSRWHEQDRQMPLRQMCQVLDWETVLVCTPTISTALNPTTLG
jgi:hypothetical protein